MAAVAAMVGVSGALVWATPAGAVTAPNVCGPDGTLLSGNICELQYTTVGAHDFTPSASVSKLQVLLVAGGGSGENTGTVGGYGGGGGEVKIVDFSDNTTSTPMTFVVGGTDQASSAQEGADAAVTAQPGGDAFDNGGTSGNGNTGGGSSPGGGGGAGGGTTTADGGAGVVAENAPVTGLSGSDFAGDTNCYGGGGAGGNEATDGVSTCGGGYVTGTTTQVVHAPVANSGGGGGSSDSVTSAATAGASGIVVVRWVPITVTLSFSMTGHGTAIAPETLAIGTAPVQPANPTAAGYVFKGWYTDPSLTTKADFTTPITASTTFYAKWVAALPTTGLDVNPLVVPIGSGALAGGVGLLLLARRRRAQLSR